MKARRHKAEPPDPSGVAWILSRLMCCTTDRGGHFVPGLNAKNLAVFEDRAPQRLAFCSAEGDLPLVAVGRRTRGEPRCARPNQTRLLRASAVAERRSVPVMRSGLFAIGLRSRPWPIASCSRGVASV